MAMTGIDDADDAARFDQLLSRLCEHPARPAKNICEPVRDPERAVGAIAREALIVEPHALALLNWLQATCSARSSNCARRLSSLVTAASSMM
jgi:hypothetical protein